MNRVFLKFDTLAKLLASACPISENDQLGHGGANFRKTALSPNSRYENLLCNPHSAEKKIRHGQAERPGTNGWCHLQDTALNPQASEHSSVSRVARKAGEECERTLAIMGPGATFSLCPIVHHPRKVITTFTTFNCCPTWQEFDTVPNVPTLPALSQKMTRGSPPLPPYNVTSASTTLSS